MRIGGQTFSDHFVLLRPLFLLIIGIWLLRIVIGATHVPSWFLAIFSLSAALPVTILFAALMIHIRRFGGYANVVLAAILLVAWGQALIALAIAFSVVSGMSNVFTMPEFSFPGDDPYHLRHILGHLIIIPFGSVLGAAMGCFVLWLLRRLVPEGG